ncbi:hypothetical protein [Eikenella corrodens]|uniref:hypothetical protein n=1 Tax=Eikenella corrodens TaxID=539 RepID=UPI00129AC2AF|nr:hypothetical protein [Eikenella corrodens]
MKKYWLSMLLLPLAAQAVAESPELARCRQVLKDNMEIMVFTMPCPPDASAGNIPQHKFENHLRQVARCNSLLETRYAADAARVQAELNAYVEGPAAEARAFSRNPQHKQAYCHRQNATARRLLMRY